MSSQTNPLSTVLTQITYAELTLLKGPLLDFSKALQAPNANVLSLENELANIALQLPAAFRTGPDPSPSTSWA